MLTVVFGQQRGVAADPRVDHIAINGNIGLRARRYLALCNGMFFAW